MRVKYGGRESVNVSSNTHTHTQTLGQMMLGMSSTTHSLGLDDVGNIKYCPANSHLPLLPTTSP